MLFQPGLVTGTVYTTYGRSAFGDAVTVSELVNGVGSITVQTDSNGNYILFLGAGFAPGSQLVVYTSGAGAGVSYQQNVTAATALNIYGTYLSQTTPGTTASGLASGLATAIGSNSAVLNGLANKLIVATGPSFSIDQSINAGTLVFSATGAVTQTQSGMITATNLALLGSGASYSLTNTGNQVGTLAANTGSLAVNSSVPLTVNTVVGTDNITATGSVSLNADSITLTASTGTITAGQDVTLAPNTAGQVIFVGSGASGLVINAATIALISADTLAIGSATAGDLTVNQSITPNANNLALVSGGAVTQTTGTITVGGLGLQGTTITLSGCEHRHASFAWSSASAPNLTLSGDLTVAAIGPDQRDQLDGFKHRDVASRRQHQRHGS